MTNSLSASATINYKTYSIQMVINHKIIYVLL